MNTRGTVGDPAPVERKETVRVLPRGGEGGDGGDGGHRASLYEQKY